MVFLIALIHGTFMALFFIFGRYIECGILGFIFLIFLIKIIPTIDIFKKPKFLKKEVSGKESIYQSLYFSSGILFYLALVGISISASGYFSITSNLRLFQYCIFFLTSIIYTLYLIFYTKSPGIIAIFRVHCIIVGIFLSILSIVLVFWSTGTMGYMLLNSVFILFGLLAVLILDRDIPYTSYITALYTLLGLMFSCMLAFIYSISLFHQYTLLYTLFLSVAILAGLYIFLPQLLKRSLAVSYVPYGVWHTRNTLLLGSWGILIALLYVLFISKTEPRSVVLAGLILLLMFWSWVYIHTERSPVFFSGNMVVLTALYSYVFFYVLPPLFWLLLLCLFVFVGILLLFARSFYDKEEEFILAINAILFMCIADFYFIFSGHYTLFLISMLFFLQSFLWYGVYEIFHRYSHAKNASL